MRHDECVLYELSNDKYIQGVKRATIYEYGKERLPMIRISEVDVSDGSSLYELNSYFSSREEALSNLDRLTELSQW